MTEQETSQGIDRRAFVAGAAGVALFSTVSRPSAALGVSGSSLGYPFTLGVASGDPLPRRVVIWTRLAPEPTAVETMIPDDVWVHWEVAADPTMGRLIRKGRTLARARHGHSVHVDVAGLEPGHTYWYRFRAGAHLSPIGRTRTAPRVSARPAALSLGLVSCQRYSSGWYRAYEDLVATEPDLVVHVGDYIYESGGGGVRRDDLPESITLDQYRNRYGLYKGDPALQAAHALAPWLVTWDDHEVENNYTDEVPEAGSATPDPAAFLARRAAAYKAYWEHMPLRIRPPRGIDMRIYRRIRWGNLADILVLDGRQYRSDQLCGTNDIGAHCDFSFEDGTTYLGERQERWVQGRLRRGNASWSVLAQQTLFSRMSFTPQPGFYNLDGWDGYPLARRRLTEAMDQYRPSNNIVLTGDIHASGVSDVLADYDDPSSAVVGAEFVGTSISSSGSSLLAAVLPSALENNEHLKWFDTSQRGWVHHRVTADQWRADYRHVDDARVLDSPIRTATSWVVPDGGAVEQV